MDISTYYSNLPVGGRKALADALDVPPAFLYQIATGRRAVPPTLCRDVERATGGAVTRYDLRPDVFGPAPTEQAA